MDDVRNDVISGLTLEETDKLLLFQDLTATEDLSKCRDILERHQWDLEVAVQDQLNMREGRPSFTAADSKAPIVVHDRNIQHVFYTPPRADQVGGIFGFFRSIYNFFTVTFYTNIFWLLQTILGFNTPTDKRVIRNSQKDVAEFKKFYEFSYGLSHPVFYQGTYSQALNDAKQGLNFLLIYLHNDSILDAQLFCLETLTNIEVVDFINTHMLFWACSMESSEGRRVMKSLRVNHYPFLAIIALKRRKMTVVGRIEGFNNPEMLLRHLNVVKNTNEIYLRQARTIRVEQNITRSLRNQQDQAYQESLKADQEKERIREQERQAILEQENQMETERTEDEARLLAINKEKRRSAQRIAREPDASDPKAVQIVFKLPCGSRLNRRFHSTDSLENLFHYVLCHPLAPDNFEIRTHFPRRVLHCRRRHFKEKILTLREAGFKNRELLFVHDLDR